ncbi:hypothetical protein K0M31_011652 [Melipona bicolor]|uniref:Uncharacterized protein n=1 Tax=Melipona bicolor TaxID=60889 RepID=A0AA40KUV3_9HYME|nr:hypothetical protein K0M31_011652 [Melipona bicolor]
MDDAGQSDSLRTSVGLAVGASGRWDFLWVASRFYVEQRTRGLRAAWKSQIVERGGKRLDLIDGTGEFPLEGFVEWLSLFVSAVFGVFRWYLGFCRLEIFFVGLEDVV